MTTTALNEGDWVIVVDPRDGAESLRRVRAAPRRLDDGTWVVRLSGLDAEVDLAFCRPTLSPFRDSRAEGGGRGE